MLVELHAGLLLLAFEEGPVGCRLRGRELRLHVVEGLFAPDVQGAVLEALFFSADSFELTQGRDHVGLSLRRPLLLDGVELAQRGITDACGRVLLLLLLDNEVLVHFSRPLECDELIEGDIRSFSFTDVFCSSLRRNFLLINASFY